MVLFNITGLNYCYAINRKECNVSIVTRPQTLFPITNPHFADGFDKGRIWYFNGEADLPLDDSYLIETIAGMCERQAHKSRSDLAWHLGFVFGMVTGSAIPD